MSASDHSPTPMSERALTWQADHEPSLLISVAHTWIGSLEFGRHIFYLSKERAAEPLEHHRPVEGSKVVTWVDVDLHVDVTPRKDLLLTEPEMARENLPLPYTLTCVDPETIERLMLMFLVTCGS